MRRLALPAALLLAACAEPAPVQPVVAEAPVTPASAPMGRAEISIQGMMVQGGIVRGAAPSGTQALELDGKPVAVANDGTFILGFDRDQPASAMLVATLADGRTVQRALNVAPRSWRIEHVNVAQRPSGATADYLKMREGELARIGAARAVNAASEGWKQTFHWPARGRISGVFGSQRVYRGEPGAYHSGVDVAAGAGAPVVAPADGVVVLAGPPALSLEGNLIIIDHGMGLNSAFLHLATQTVRQGQQVKRGQMIGTVGATGRATGPHLHWSMKWNEARLDPQLLAGPMAMAAR